MKPKFKMKLAVDMCLTALLLLLMAYSLIGEQLHEWLGAAMLTLTIAHMLLHLNWYRNLCKGSYSPLRMVQTALNIATSLCMLGLAISGIVLSRYVFEWIPSDRGGSFARALHMFCSYWGFVLLSLHAGLHRNMVAAKLRKRFRIEKATRKGFRFLRMAEVVLCAYGVYAFVKQDIVSYLFLKTHFVFFDFSKPLAFFFIDYIAIMLMLYCAGNYLHTWLRKGFLK